jgi:hypothetical protein
MFAGDPIDRRAQALAGFDGVFTAGSVTGPVASPASGA